MSMATIVAIVLAGAALLGGVRAWRNAARHRLVLVALQCLAAGVAFAFLFPGAPGRGGELVVLTGGAFDPPELAFGAEVVALPEASACAADDCGSSATRHAQRVPDLATALRLHPSTTSLRVLGDGLRTRDRDAARALPLRFEPGSATTGFVALQAPTLITAGRRWILSGRVQAPSGARVALRDPGDAVLETATPGADGAFRFEAPSRLPGPALFHLRLLGAADAALDEIAMPVFAQAAQPVRVLLLAGAPDPELKYLRRWALDANIGLDVRLGLAPGTALGPATAPREKAALSEYALAIVDERAWAALDATQRRALEEAVDDGLGLLLRATGPVPKTVQDDWRALGYAITPARIAGTVSLGRAFALEPGQTGFARVPLEVTAADATALLRDDDGAPLALMRAKGRGRVALWWLQDSFRLALTGAPERHATLWSRVAGSLARALDEPSLVLPADARVGERVSICGVSDGATVEPPAGRAIALVADEATGASRCAAFWPEQPGWHALADGERRASLLVRGRNEARTLAAATDRAATAELAARTPAGAAHAAAPLPERALWALALLVLSGVLWGLERRAATPAPPTPGDRARELG